MSDKAFRIEMLLVVLAIVVVSSVAATPSWKSLSFDSANGNVVPTFINLTRGAQMYGANLAVDTDARFSDARTPTSHKTSHRTGGSDALTAADIGADTAGTAAGLVANKLETDSIISSPTATVTYASDSLRIDVVGGGTVTSVTAASPLSSTGGTTPVISMAADSVARLLSDGQIANIAVAANHVDSTTSAHGGIVPASRKINNQLLSGDITLISADVGADTAGTASSAVSVHANAYNHAGIATAVNHVDSTTTAHGGIVPSSRTINGQTLSSNITLPLGLAADSIHAGANVTLLTASDSVTISSTAMAGADASTDSEFVVFSGTGGKTAKRSNVFASTFAAASHTQAQSTITGLTTADTPTFAGLTITNAMPQSQVRGLVSDLSGKAASSHTHAESDVTNLTTDLSAKMAGAASSVDSEFVFFNGTDGKAAKRGGVSMSNVKTQLSLNNVENTALSSWAGSANITTLGTISTGTIPQANVTNLTTDLSAKVAGSAASVDSEFMVFSGTGGKTAKQSGVFSSTFAAASHTQAQSTITGLTTTDTANFAGLTITNAMPQSQVRGLVSDLSGKAASSHTHAESDVTNLTTDLSAKMAGAASSVDSEFVFFSGTNGKTAKRGGVTMSNVKTQLSLNNVENTALSSWAGSANITTLGTISTGTIPQANVTNLTTDLSAKIAGSAASVDSEFMVFSGTTGKTVKQSGVFASTFAPSSHTHVQANITDLESTDTATFQDLTITNGIRQNQIRNLTGDLAGKAATSHTHAESDVTNLTTDLSAKMAGAASSVDSEFVFFSGTDGKAAKRGGVTMSNVKTQLSLNNVENTALSSWAGSANITTLGTISTGTIPQANVTNLTTDLSAKVAGSAASVDSEFMVFSGTTGKTVKQSGVFASTFAPSSHTHVQANITDLESTDTATFQDLTITNGIRQNQVRNLTTDLAAKGDMFKADNLSGLTNTTARNNLGVTAHPDGFEEATVANLAVAYTGRQFTITPTGTVYYWCNGVRYGISSPQTTTAHANTTGSWYCYYSYDSPSTLVVASSAWDIMSTTQVAYAYYNASTGNARVYKEKHLDVMSNATHKYEHVTSGGKYVSGHAISGYTLTTNNDTARSYAIASGVIADEDLMHSQTGVAQGGDYRLFYRTGLDTDNAWTWTTSTQAKPYLIDGSSDIYYNYYNTSTKQWEQATTTTNNRWINYYVCSVPDTVSTYQAIIVQGQALYTTLAAAQAENIAINISWGTTPFNELVPLYQVCYRRAGNSGNWVIDSVTKIANQTTATITGSSPSQHNALAGRDAISSHPQAAIEGLTTSDTGYFLGTSTTNISTTNATIGRIYGGVTIDTPRVSGSLVVDSPLSTSIPTLFIDAANDNVGIGTPTPLWNMHIAKTLTGTQTVGLGIQNIGTYTWGIGIDRNIHAACLQFMSGGLSGTPRMTITNYGEVGIGTTSPGYTLQVVGTAGLSTSDHWTNTSDVRLKDDVATISSALDKVLAMRGVTYKWKPSAGKGDGGKRHVGLVAQEVEQVMPEWVDVNNEGYKTVNVSGDTALFIEAIKALNAKIEALENRIKILEAK